MRGKLYSVGIGPGDPELMTLKAVRLLKECDVVALPKGDGDIMTAKNIVNQIVNIDEKEQVVIYMPMTKDKDALAKAHQEGATPLPNFWTKEKTWCLSRLAARLFTLPAFMCINWCLKQAMMQNSLPV